MEGGAILIGWVHMVTAAIWIGGIFFIGLVFGPVAERSESPEAKKLLQATAKRFTPIAWGAVIILIATGLVRTAGLGALNFDTLINTLYGNLLLGKIALIVIVIVNGVVIARASLKMSKLAAATPPPLGEMDKQMIRIKYIGQINLILGLIILFLAVALRVVGF